MKPKNKTTGILDMLMEKMPEEVKRLEPKRKRKGLKHGQETKVNP